MIKIKDRYFNIEIEYKSNKNMYLRIKDGSTIKITCPRFIKRDDIIKFILSKEDAIFKMIETQEKRQENSLLRVGNTIFYRGKEYELKIVSGHDDFKIVDHTLIIYSKDLNIDEALKVFYSKAKNILLNDIKEIESKYLNILADYNYHLVPKYKFRLMKSRWGVCYTKKNEICLNTYLIHFPKRCLEAVLWHELLHFAIPNHSKRFHEVLEYHMPNYKIIERSLR